MVSLMSIFHRAWPVVRSNALRWAWILPFLIGLAKGNPVETGPRLRAKLCQRFQILQQLLTIEKRNHHLACLIMYYVQSPKFRVQAVKLRTRNPEL